MKRGILILIIFIIILNLFNLNAENIKNNNLKEEDITEFLKQYDKNVESLPDIAGNMFKNERINIYLDNSIFYGLIVKNKKIKEHKKNGIENPSLNLYTSSETLSKLKNNEIDFKEAIDNREINYSGTTFFKKIKFGFVSFIYKKFFRAKSPSEKSKINNDSYIQVLNESNEPKKFFEVYSSGATTKRGLFGTVSFKTNFKNKNYNWWTWPRIIRIKNNTKEIPEKVEYFIKRKSDSQFLNINKSSNPSLIKYEWVKEEKLGEFLIRQDDYANYGYQFSLNINYSNFKKIDEYVLSFRLKYLNETYSLWEEYPFIFTELPRKLITFYNPREGDVLPINSTVNIFAHCLNSWEYEGTGCPIEDNQYSCGEPKTASIYLKKQNSPTYQRVGDRIGYFEINIDRNASFYNNNLCHYVWNTSQLPFIINGTREMYPSQNVAYELVLEAEFYTRGNSPAPMYSLIIDKINVTFK